MEDIVKFTVNTKGPSRKLANELFLVFLRLAYAIEDRLILKKGRELIFDLAFFQAQSGKKYRWYADVNASITLQLQTSPGRFTTVYVYTIGQIHLLDNETIVQDCGTCAWTTPGAMEFLKRR